MECNNDLANLLLAEHLTVQMKAGVVDSSLQADKEQEEEEEEEEEGKEKQLVEMVQEIKRQVEEELTVRLLNPSIEHFKALSAFSKQFPAVCHKIEVIWISLDPKVVFEPWQQIAIGGTLCEIIVYLRGLRELTLHHFGVTQLLAAQATLDTQQHLTLVNWEHNSLIDSDLPSLSLTLPDEGNLKLVLSHNSLQDERELAAIVSVIACTNDVELFQQEGRTLNEARFRAELAELVELWGSDFTLKVC